MSYSIVYLSRCADYNQSKLRMQRVLLRENKIDQEKQHFWIVGMNQAEYILYIELITLASYKSVNIEPMKGVSRGRNEKHPTCDSGISPPIRITDSRWSG